MAAHETWQWQEPGTTWKGAGLYHITLTVTDRRPMLGTLVIPDGNPTMAKVRRTALGDALVDCLLTIPSHHAEVRVLHFCLMPDHLHAVLYVQRHMPKGIKAVVRGFWQGTKKLGRAWTVASSLVPNDIREKYKEGLNTDIREKYKEELSIDIREKYKEEINTDIRGGRKEGGSSRLKGESAQLTSLASRLSREMGEEDYYQLEPVFREMPFIRPMGRYSQLQNTIRYIDMNPQRLATKRLKPGFFRVQKDIEIGHRKYDGVGNVALLMEDCFATVHVRHQMVEMAEHGNSQSLRDYMNSCVLKARKGVVMVSPFISPQEKQVMQVLLKEQRPFVLLTDNGFREYYKPADYLFDACAAGRLLILSPWPYDGGKRHISRADCVALNAMAEEICLTLVPQGQ